MENEPSSHGYQKKNEPISSEAMEWLNKLDRGLRSNQISEQVENIVRFKDLIHQFPIPIIVNTSLLKLSELYKNTENHMIRYWIMSVMTQIHPTQYWKVFNKQELIKRITFVLNNNDSTARALTLKILSNMALIIKDRIDLFHKFVFCWN